MGYPGETEEAFEVALRAGSKVAEEQAALAVDPHGVRRSTTLRGRQEYNPEHGRCDVQSFGWFRPLNLNESIGPEGPFAGVPVRRPLSNR